MDITWKGTSDLSMLASALIEPRGRAGMTRKQVAEICPTEKEFRCFADPFLRAASASYPAK
jgi:hypothetical protein